MRESCKHWALTKIVMMAGLATGLFDLAMPMEYALRHHRTRNARIARTDVDHELCDVYWDVFSGGTVTSIASGVSPDVPFVTSCLLAGSGFRVETERIVLVTASTPVSARAGYLLQSQSRAPPLSS